MSKFFVGTASWTDPTLLDAGTFYPPEVKTPEQRLRFYASRFNTVEVDSTYYTLVSERVAALWSARTPDEFIFNVKAFGMLTLHPVDISRLPKVLQSRLSVSSQLGSNHKPDPATLELAFQMFYSSLRPLINAKKLGFVVFQFPPYFLPSSDAYNYLGKLRSYLPEVDIAVEFRHRSWVVPEESRVRTLKVLSDTGLYYVSVDEPQASSTMPSLLEVIGGIAYVRFHGRNRINWFKRNITTAERYMYLYSENELREWAERIKSRDDISRAFLIFNNCYRDFAVTNAAMMSKLLEN